MAISFFGLAIFLFLTLDSDFTSSPISAASEGVPTTYGSVIKLMHEKTKFRLHSHDIPYGSGSGQQSVTGFPNVDDSNSYWIVRPVPDTNAQQGDTIKGGTVIRLQHMRTRKWLHSHLLNICLLMTELAAVVVVGAYIDYYMHSVLWDNFTSPLGF
ncbi:stromal cell-derived factor 2-like protein [Coffea eugenioides]|uniref:stromal cell-derived factor 2-like protein n=1 Tax=Coffea eugenioides TaxID=49369 RepID=UPI000F60CB65|nr:stromal cell-derived factor 2-like protein [Coffea eugenioides]